MPTRLIAMLVLGWLLAAPATAEVFKCTAPDGSVTYSDERCGSKAQALDERQLRANSVPALARPRPSDARASEAAAAQPVAAATAESSLAGVCPSANDIRNLEVSAGSLNLGRVERDFMYAELRRARACSREGGRYTADDWQRIRNGQSAQTESSIQAREAARAMVEAIHSAAASNREFERMQTEKLIEAERERGPPVVIVPAVPRRPIPITGCDARGCRGTDGTPFDRNARNGTFTRADGASCRVVGSVMRCDR